MVKAHCGISCPRAKENRRDQERAPPSAPVRSGSKAAAATLILRDRFTPESGHSSQQPECQLRAIFDRSPQAAARRLYPCQKPTFATCILSRRSANNRSSIRADAENQVRQALTAI